MVACDFDNHFVHVSSGWEGSASDARVLQDALENNFYVPEGKFYLVDIFLYLSSVPSVVLLQRLPSAILPAYKLGD